MSMPSKPRTDEERRAWLQLSRLKGERDRLQHERDQLRQQLMAALSLGDLWPGIPAQELRDRLTATVDAWEATVAGIRAVDAARRGSAPVRVPEPIIGGRQEIGVIMTRIR